MRYGELRAFFLDLAAAAVPVPLILTACGGAVSLGDESGGARSSDTDAGGVGDFGARGGTGGMGSTNGYPFAPGTGGTGGYPFALGTGGTYPKPTYPSPANGDAAAPGAPDAGPAEDAPLPADGGVELHDGAASQALDHDAGSGPLDAACSTGDGAVTCAARRPPGLERRSIPGSGELRKYFGEMARLETASITAFRIMARELVHHGAPASLRRAALSAAREEVSHARLSRQLVRRFEASYEPPRMSKRPLRSIEALALDNASEGCVRETFGAVLATWQSRAATDPVVRNVMHRIALDETRHAAFAIAVAKWADTRLDRAARARVRALRRRTGESMLCDAEYQPSPALLSIAGVPRPEDALRLARAAHARLWA